MSLIIEDGTIVINAVAYADLTYIKAYATARGITLGGDTVIEQQVLIAMDYIESKRNRFQGLKVSEFQSLQFPRNYLVIDGYAVASNVIPKELKNALAQLVIEQFNGVNILPTVTEAPVKKEVVGPITTEYAVNPGDLSNLSIPAVDNLLEPLFKNVSSGGFALTTLRI